MGLDFRPLQRRDSERLALAEGFEKWGRGVWGWKPPPALDRSAAGHLSPMICPRCTSEFEPKYVQQIYCGRRCAKSEYSHRKWKRNANYVNELKAANGCSWCPERRIACLDYHHLDRSTKKAGICELVRSGTTLTKLKAEIAKCILLCANCHRVEEADGVNVDFYPAILRTNPPTVLTRAEVDQYWAGKVCKVFHIPATHPRDEGGAQSGPE